MYLHFNIVFPSFSDNGNGTDDRKCRREMQLICEIISHLVHPIPHVAGLRYCARNSLGGGATATEA